MSRVLLIDADSLTPEQVRVVVSSGDYAIVAGNDNQDMKRWYALAGIVKELRVNEVPAAIKQGADLALAFSAGEALSTTPTMRQLPWLIMAKDRDLEAITALLHQRDVRNVVQIALRKPRAKKSKTRAQPNACKSPEGVALDRVFSSNGGYPLALNKIPAILKQPGLGKMEGAVRERFRRKGGVRKSLCALGFTCDARFVLKSPV